MVQKTIKTMARQTQDELLEETKNSSLLLQPFATRNYDMESVRLQTSLPEIDILLGTPAIVRQGFEQDDINKRIVIPTIFAKVDGVPENESAYIKHLDKINESTGLEALVSIHFISSDWFISDSQYDEIMSDFSVQNLMDSDAWPYGMANRLLQKKIAQATINMINEWPFLFEKDRENMMSVISMALDLPQELVEMSLEVDYPKEVPTLAFVHKEELGQITRDDVVALNMFHYLGWDVVVYSPHSFASLENYMPEDTFDYFSYETVKNTNASKGDTKPSFFKKLFK